jgi:hypothetical protein
VAAHHYVSKFHLREFCVPESLRARDPWLWYGNISDSSVTRRPPSKVGTSPDLFNGPGALEDDDANLESYLANNVEGPAARAIRKMTNPTARLDNIPPEVMRYLAWAASRSLPMQRLEAEWTARLGNPRTAPMAEPTPEAILDAAPRIRPMHLVHPLLGEITVPAGEDWDPLIDLGWSPDPRDRANFLESAHIQSYYFQERWFPRLLWFTLRTPPDEHFIIGDRPVGWGVPDCLDAPPCCLRDPAAFLIAPLSRSLALVGRNAPEAWAVTSRQVNAILASWSHQWIAGPTAAVVATAMSDRLQKLPI